MNAAMKIATLRRARRGFRSFSKADGNHLSKAGGIRDIDGFLAVVDTFSCLQNGRGWTYSTSRAMSCPPPMSRVAPRESSEARSLSGRNESSRAAIVIVRAGK